MEAQLKWEKTLKTNALSIRYGDGLGEGGETTHLFWVGGKNTALLPQGLKHRPQF